MRVPVLLALVLAGVAGPGAEAQPGDVGQAYAEGAARLAAGDAEGAARALGPVVQADPAYSGGAGSAAFLLGSALGADAGAAVWARGRAALAARGLVDVRLDEALVWAGAASGADSLVSAAADAYLSVLARSDVDALRPHLRALALVAPPSDASAMGLPDRPDRAAAVAWWHGQDPLPATPRNERLEEHLRRLAHARSAFGGEAFDARGEVYVRFGPPERTDEVHLDAGEFARYVPDLVTAFRPSEVPQNEVWAYPSLDRTATFLFVSRDDGAYRLGTPEDLLPRSLRGGTGSGERGRRRAEALLLALDTIYRQLAHYSPRYHGLALDVSDYTSVIDMAYREQAFAVAEVNRQGRGGADLSQSVLGDMASPAEIMSSGLDQTPGVYVQTLLGESAAVAMELASEREERVPVAQSGVLRNVREVPVAFRASRFLTPTGQTRLDLDWAADAGAETDTLYLAWTGVVQDSAFEEVERLRSDLLVPPAEGAFPVQSASVALPVGGRHVAAQWDLRPFERVPGGRLRPGRRVGVNAVRAGPLGPLRATGFEVSDLRPLRAVENEPYPFVRAEPGLPLSVYFEIYGLDEERGQFGVEYAVVRRSGGRVLRRSRQEVEAEGQLRSRAVGGRSAQYLILNTTGWAGADEVEVQVVVTSRAGERVERSVRFVVAER